MDTHSTITPAWAAANKARPIRLRIEQTARIMTQISPRIGSLLLGITLLCLSAAPAHAVNDLRLPEIGDPAGGIMTPTQEQRLGQAFMRNIRNSMPVATDPLISGYLRSLGNKLVSYSSAAGQPFDFFLVEDPLVNAFAGPAGHIGVFTGLVLATETESELASVIAHEIAHVSQKHLVRAFDAAKRMSLPMTAMVLAAIVVGSQTDSNLGMAAASGIQSGFMQQQINFTRANEQEADRMGIRILEESGFEPRAMPVFFERMGRATRFYGSQLPEFLRTHPVTTSRIADSRGRAEAYPYRQHPDDIRYHLLRATLREKAFENPKDAVRFFQESLAEGRYRSEAGQRYGYILALMRTREYRLARSELDKLLRKAPHQVAYQIMDARLYQESGQQEQARRVLESALNLLPDNYPLAMAYARTLLNMNKPQMARQALERLLSGRPRDTLLYKLLSQATGDAGDISQAHEYLAEYYYLSGDLGPAAQQLEIALRDRDTSLFRSTRMAARLKQIRQEIAELKHRE